MADLSERAAFYQFLDNGGEQSRNFLMEKFGLTKGQVSSRLWRWRQKNPDKAKYIAPTPPKRAASAKDKPNPKPKQKKPCYDSKPVRTQKEVLADCTGLALDLVNFPQDIALELVVHAFNGMDIHVFEKCGVLQSLKDCHDRVVALNFVQMRDAIEAQPLLVARDVFSIHFEMMNGAEYVDGEMCGHYLPRWILSFVEDAQWTQ